jgi:hypothetical protein
MVVLMLKVTQCSEDLWTLSARLAWPWGRHWGGGSPRETEGSQLDSYQVQAATQRIKEAMGERGLVAEHRCTKREALGSIQ